MSINDSIMQIFLDSSLYYYDFDLNSGIVQNDIICKNGVNYTKTLGLASPCAFDEIVNRSYSSDFLDVNNLNSKAPVITLKVLQEAYNNGQNTLVSNIYFPLKEEYNRISYYLLNLENNEPHVFVCCYDITAAEKTRITALHDLQTSKNETEDIIASAQIGIWHIYLFDGEKPRFKATPKMLELLGIDSKQLTEEEVYDAWYNNIKRSSLPSVKASVNEMMEKGFSENTYTWIHPTKGEIYVRCGGTAHKVEGKGYILRGYHSDVTETVNSETKQKQLLADALDEVSKQKKLLQEALDNYKEADYDRRRDFLTGLRNRQDMFDMIQDSLSGKREKITSMYMMDIDNFKMLNDHYGHLYGDECLKKIGDALNKYSEDNDIYFYRYGGEEILGIGFTTKKKPSQIADELLKLIFNLNIKRDDLPTGAVTISLGYTTNNSRYEKMIDKADTAMYHAKDNGKNQAICFEEM